MKGKHKYGRGKFEVDKRYIRYMKMIVTHPNYKGMPNAMSRNGRINWQVSSGVNTSFYKDYLARKAWWVRKADHLHLPGKGDENDRFTVAARMIHPTGYRTCRLCGKSFNVGYFYVNHHLALRLNKEFPKLNATKGQPIDEVLVKLLRMRSKVEVSAYLGTVFPERTKYFQAHGPTKAAFEASRHIRTHWLSPGFMGNPPDRLDGFHDYHLECRKKKDPGRADENMRSYIHDRRSFVWWAEGNWMVTDALYNSAGSGNCLAPNCGKSVKKVSPDHVGPLACGFKQIPLFVPTCTHHNSAKNRRFTYSDVQALLEFEKATGESVASWQVRAHWDHFKTKVRNDDETKALSNSLRSLQDMYLRTLWVLYEAGQVRFLATLLRPEYALQDVKFVGLDPARLTFESTRTSEKTTALRKSLAARTVRIAFESLRAYASKPIAQRKMVRSDFDENRELIEEAVAKISRLDHPQDADWIDAVCEKHSTSDREKRISLLLVDGKACRHPADQIARRILQGLFDRIGRAASIDFTRYALVADAD